MQVRKLLLPLFFTSLLQADFEYKVHNSNFTLAEDSFIPASSERYVYNYERLRFRGDFTQGAFFATLIGDGANYYSQEYVNSLDFSFVKNQHADVPFQTQSSFRDYAQGSAYAKLYRLYGGYEDDANRVTVGLQNIAMGVGRIWTPTNLFNPRNIYALEPDETYGVFALSYSRYVGEATELNVVASQKADYSYKYALRYKSSFELADVGVAFLHSDTTTMAGCSVEGNLGQSGVEVRSEGAYIKNKDEALGDFFQGIIGADYAFVQSVTLTAEALLSSKTYTQTQLFEHYNSEVAANLVSQHFYTAFLLSYDYSIYLNAALLYIESFEPEERFVAPSLTYTLNDYNSFSLGAQLQKAQQRYYFNWELAF